MLWIHSTLTSHMYDMCNVHFALAINVRETEKKKKSFEKLSVNAFFYIQAHTERSHTTQLVSLSVEKKL